MEMIPLLEKLTQACGVAGDEGPIADLLEQEIKDIGPVRRTPLGSLICTVKQEAPEKPHVVLEAHIDEIGLMVCAIDEDAPAVQLIKAHQKIDKRGFATAGRPHNGNACPGLCLQAKIF